MICIDSAGSRRIMRQWAIIGNSSLNHHQVCFNCMCFPVLDKTKFTVTEFHRGGRKTRLMSNQKRFKSAKCIADDLYEMQFGHGRIAIDLPIQVTI